MGLADGLSSEVPLARTGDNVFRVLVFDSQGRALSFPNSLITIAKTAATVEAIPSSSSIAIEALDKIGGNSVPVYIVRQGQQLPAAGQVRFKAAESLRAGGPGTIQLKLWEGEIDSPLSDNRFIGALTIVGSDFDEGMIAAGDDVICNYEVSDSGNIILEATVDSIGGTFRQGNFYSRRSGEIDLTDAHKLIAEDAQSLLHRARDVASRVQNPSLNLVLNNLSSLTASSVSDGDPESAKRAIDEILEAKMLLAKVRTENRKEIRQLDLDNWLTFFNEHIKRFASAAEITVVETTVRSAQRSIDENRSDFESQLDELRSRAFAVMWRQDWFVVDRFSDLADSVHLFPDRKHHASLVDSGKKALSADDIDTLRDVVFELDSVRLGTGDQDRMLGTTNIVRAQ
jgi:molecular chaperone DnaK